MRIRSAAFAIAFGSLLFDASVSSAQSKPAPKQDAAKAEAAKSAAAKADVPKPINKAKPASGKPESAAATVPKSQGGASKGKAVAKGKKGARAPRAKGPPGEPDAAARRIIAGTTQTLGNDARESPELKAMRELDEVLFPPKEKETDVIWSATAPVANDSEATLGGLPPRTSLSRGTTEQASDLTWLKQLTMPDFPTRLDARVIRYLEYYRNDPRGRSMVSTWLKRSGRYGSAIRRVLHEEKLPEDVLWLALVESGFDPTIASPAGAVGMWQFMAEGARIYGLTVDRWVDERLDPERSTLAAARYLSDLYQRFGSWELVFAAYNMGYGGLLAAIRKYNTNDFWELSRMEAGVPLETALHVPKIVAMAIVARNRSMFGCNDLELDPAVSFDKIAVGPGVPLRSVAVASGADLPTIENLNPQITAGRTPPAKVEARHANEWILRVPPGTGRRAAQYLSSHLEREAKLDGYEMRWGETLENVAERYRVPRATLASVNGVRRDEVIRPGTILFIPTGAQAEESKKPAERPVVWVKPVSIDQSEKTRVLYRVVAGDNLSDLAQLFGVHVEDLCAWNDVAPNGKLFDGMTLQVFVPKGQDLSSAFVLSANEAKVMHVGSDDFFAYFEGQKGRKRIEIEAQKGDSWPALAKRYGLTLGMLERINHRPRTSKLTPGDKLVVYVPSSRVGNEQRPLEEASVAVAATETPATEMESGQRPEDSVRPAVLKNKPKPESPH